MADDDKTKRAAEIDKAIREADAKRSKRDDDNVDLGTERASGGGGQELDKLLAKHI